MLKPDLALNYQQGMIWNYVQLTNKSTYIYIYTYDNVRRF